MEGGGGERKRKAGAIHIDWGRVFPDKNDCPPPSLVIEPAKPESTKRGGGDEEPSEQGVYVKKMSDSSLIETIARTKRNLEGLSSKLSDGGQKYRDLLRKCQAELESRKQAKKYDNKSNDATQSAGAPDDLSPVETIAAPRSTFSRIFGSKLDDKRENQSFSKELSLLNHCDKKDNREIRRLSRQRNESNGLSSREVPFKSPRQLSANIDDPKQSNCEQFGSGSASASSHCSYRFLSDVYAEKEPTPHYRTRRGARQKDRGTLVLLDEELEVSAKEQMDVDKRMKEFRIYYPSRDDAEAVEICYTDMECLDPEAYLSSTIMNFYIKYLQRLRSSNPRSCNYHFFNTYFYSKLKQDVLSEANKETPFFKFRRWWKGVNIFEKAYILLPINESHHWSLVIICMPSKEDESGPIILHLDSLGMHSCRTLFGDVKSFLLEEWNFLRREELLPEPPMASSIWDKLSRRIAEKVMEVPQQKNDYDCGLFVLYFIERFIEDAPERLTKKDLEMFGRAWFKPEDASNLRRKIRVILEQEFEHASSKTDACKLDL